MIVDTIKVRIKVKIGMWDLLKFRLLGLNRKKIEYDLNSGDAIKIEEEKL